MSISPEGIYDADAVRDVLPRQMAALFHPYVPEGMTVTEQLASMGLRPEDLEYVLLTHLDPDHVAGVKSVGGRTSISGHAGRYTSCGSPRASGSISRWRGSFTADPRSDRTAGPMT